MKKKIKGCRWCRWFKLKDGNGEMLKSQWGWEAVAGKSTRRGDKYYYKFHSGEPHYCNSLEEAKEFVENLIDIHPDLKMKE